MPPPRSQGSSAQPYAPDREIDDLEALIAEAGGAACVYGYSSGALLAMHAAARGSAIRRLALMEPPLEDDSEPESELTNELAALIAAGRRADAVRRFHQSIGVPPGFVAGMAGSPVIRGAEAPRYVRWINRNTSCSSWPS
jgi:pimeloyl-ACP methyl ester carboxylesterase